MRHPHGMFHDDLDGFATYIRNGGYSTNA